MANGNGGRPKKPIDWKEAEKLCALQCSEQEIADWFHLTVETLARRLRDEKGMSFHEFFTLHRVQGKISLRRNLFRLSAVNASAAIFLAKNWLGMVDKVEQEITGKDGGALNVEIIVSSDAAKKLTESIIEGEGT